MVSFNCDGCGDVVKKPKLDQHRSRCGAPFTCLDCSIQFYTPADYKGHTSCISEAEKYQKTVYKPPKQKGNQANGQSKGQQQQSAPSPEIAAPGAAAAAAEPTPSTSAAPTEAAATEKKSKDKKDKKEKKDKKRKREAEQETVNGVNGEASTAGAEATTSSAAASGVNTDDEAAKAAKKAKKEAKKEAKKDKKSKEARGEEQEEEDEHKYDVIAIQNAVDALITAPPHKVSLADMVVALAKDQGVDTEDASAMQAAQSAFLNAVSIARAGQGETLTLR